MMDPRVSQFGKIGEDQTPQEFNQVFNDKKILKGMGWKDTRGLIG
jgi:hypothetical protein